MAKTYSSDTFKLDWYGEEVLLKIEEATALGLEEAAFDLEAEAKQNIVANDQIDTGFMVNSVYAKGQSQSNYGAAAAAQGMNPGAEAHAEANLEGNMDALVAVAAEYGIYQEIQQAYLYPALQTAAARAGGHLVKAAKEKGF